MPTIYQKLFWALRMKSLALGVELGRNTETELSYYVITRFDENTKAGMPSFVRLPREAFPMSVHLSVPGRCLPASTRIFPEPRSRGEGGEERQEGAQDFFTFLHFGPVFALWKNTTNLPSTLYLSACRIFQSGHHSLFSFT